MQLTENFGFLGDHDPDLVKIGALAERYFRDDPPTALIKLREFAELLSKPRRLSYERILPREAADLFHALRKYGHAAVHEARGTHAEALSGLRFARQIGIRLRGECSLSDPTNEEPGN
jgi:type I restriction enzyme R subunit